MFLQLHRSAKNEKKRESWFHTFAVSILLRTANKSNSCWIMSLLVVFLHSEQSIVHAHRHDKKRARIGSSISYLGGIVIAENGKQVELVLDHVLAGCFSSFRTWYRACTPT